MIECIICTTQSKADKRLRNLQCVAQNKTLLTRNRNRWAREFSRKVQNVKFGITRHLLQSHPSCQILHINTLHVKCRPIAFQSMSTCSKEPRPPTIKASLPCVSVHSCSRYEDGDENEVMEFARRNWLQSLIRDRPSYNTDLILHETRNSV